MATKGRIHSIETCGTVDGPGIRYVIFLQGCPLRCVYCHNPDSWDINGGNEMTVDELFEDIIKYKSYMKFSGGGVTVSGGEPLIQAEFVLELFKLLKEEGIHTAIDTSGQAPLDRVKELLSYTDLLLLDIKSIDPDTFEKVTAVKIDKTLALAQYASDQNISMWVRFVLVPETTDDPAEIEELAKYLSALQSIRRVEVLPFHKLGEYKWKQLNIPYTLYGHAVPSRQSFNGAVETFRRHGLTVEL